MGGWAQPFRTSSLKVKLFGLHRLPDSRKAFRTTGCGAAAGHPLTHEEGFSHLLEPLGSATLSPLRDHPSVGTRTRKAGKVVVGQPSNLLHRTLTLRVVRIVSSHHTDGERMPLDLNNARVASHRVQGSWFVLDRNGGRQGLAKQTVFRQC